MIQNQILQTNITRTIWQTVRRITNVILEVKGLKRYSLLVPEYLENMDTDVSNADGKSSTVMALWLPKNQKILWSLQNCIMYLTPFFLNNPFLHSLTPRGDWKVTSLYNTHTISSKQVIRIFKFIRLKLSSWFNCKFM